MNQFLTILFFLFNLTAFSQDTPATIYFNDGESVVGYGSIVKDKNPFHIPPKDKIAFRLSRNDEADLWDGDMVESIVFHFFEHSITFIFVDVIFGNKIETHLLQLITEGEVNLYSDTSSYWEKANPVNMINPFYKVDKESYMVKRNSEGKFTKLNSKKKIIEYFKNCPGIATKLNNHEFSITDLEDIVNYYNDYCAGYDFGEEEAGEEETIETEDLLEED